MELVTPDVGLIFWMLLSFTIVLVILRRYAWKPIMEALRSRENSISEALNAAEKAKEEVEQLKIDNARIIAQAKVERDSILKEARESKEEIIKDAKKQASDDAAKIIDAARKQIENEKSAAITQIRNIIASLSVEVAEQILRRELQSEATQYQFIEEVMDGLQVN